MEKRNIESDGLFAVEYLKSSLSISNYVGCGLGCRYCSVQEFASSTVKKVIEPEEAFNKLISNPLFFKDYTPITINNRTDPMLPQVKNDTFQIINLLKKNNYKNIVIIISKMKLSEKDLEFLEECNLPIVYIVSYGNFDREIEPVSNDIRIQTLKVLKNRKRLISLHYWRPIIKGLNDSEEQIRTVLDNVKSACDGSIISGLRLNQNIYSNITSLGADLSGWDGNKTHKFISKESINKIMKIRSEIAPNYPIFRHTSCAISYFFDNYDYNFHFYRDQSCLENCWNNDKCSLKMHNLNVTAIEEKDISNALIKVGCSNLWNNTLDSKGIFIKDEMSQEQISSLMHYLQIPVKAKSIRRSLSEEVFVE